MNINLEHKGIAVGLSVLLSVVFIVITTVQALNFPMAADDFIFFISQLHNKWLSVSGPKDILSYFFAPAFGIHTQSSSRILGLLSYGILGVINFKFLVIVGNICHLFMAHKFSDFIAKLHQSNYLRLIILSLLLVPLVMNFRAVFITRFPFHILFVFLCFVFLTRKKIGISFIFFLLATFSVGSGIFAGFVSLLALIIFSFENKKYIPWVLLYLVMASTLLFFLLSYKTSVAESTLNLSFNAIVSYIAYVMVFIQLSVTPYLMDYKSLPIVYIFIGIIICSTFIYLLVYKFKETTNSPLFYLCVYLFLNGFLAGLFRSKGVDILPDVAARYEHYSVIFIASFVGLVYGFISSSKVKIGIGIFFVILFLMRLHTNMVSPHTSGFKYDTFILMRNGELLRKLIDRKKYRYLYDFRYEDISQNASLAKELKKGKRTSTSNVRIHKYMDEQEMGVVSFVFKEKKDYRNIRVVLQQGKNRYSFDTYLTKFNRYYCLLAKNGDLPKGKYRLRIWYEDEQGNYEYKLKRNQVIQFH